MPAWTYKYDRAVVDFGVFNGSIDLPRPGDGVTLSNARGSLPEVHILGVALPDLAKPAAAPSEGYCRGNDLAAVYEQSAGGPMRVDCLWRALEPSASAVLGGIDLLMSVRTSLLEGRPLVLAASRVAAEEALRLVEPASGRMESLGRLGGEPVRSAGAAPRCVVFRLGADWPSYVEMVHPLSRCRDAFSRIAQGTLLHVEHGLFPESLEKGVMLRAWVRGLFVPRPTDMADAAAAYRRFAAAEPPLGT